ncbi:MAG: alpha-galactosidase, partial [Bryobacteraceae bacterium]
VIVGLFNTGNEAQTISVQRSALDLPTNGGGYLLNNLWTHKTTKTDGTISARVPSHGVALYGVRILP